MPKLLYARSPLDEGEKETLRKLARSRHAPAAWIQRARMIVQSWAGNRTTAMAQTLGCHPQTVRERLHRLNAEGLDGLDDRPGGGRQPRLSEADRSTRIALACHPPPGRPARQADGTLQAPAAGEAVVWTLNTLTTAARQQGMQVGRSQIRRMLRAEGIRWRGTRTWATREEPDVVPQERQSSRCIPNPR